MKALLYIALRRLVNSLKRIPRSPRLLLPILFFGFVIGLQILTFVVAGSRGAEPPHMFAPRDFIEGGPGALVGAIRALLLFSLLGSVVAAFGEGNLFFAQSDVDFLFPAPMSRRAILLFKMFGTYLSLLLPTLYFLFVMGSSFALETRTSPLAFWPGVLGVWMFLLAITNLTQTVLISRSPDEDESATRRARISKVVGWVLGALLLVGGYVLYEEVFGRGGVGLRSLLRLINGGAASVILFPIAWASDLFLVPFRGWGDYAVWKLIALSGIAAGSFALLFSRERDFYEGALETTARRTRLVTAVRSGDAGAIISQMAAEGKLGRGRALRSFGGGAWAIVWKDLIAATRTPLRSWLTLLFMAAFPALLGRGMGSRSGDAGLLFWMVLFTLNISNVFLFSLRDMLRRADIMKALPVAPARLLLAETMVPTANLTLLGWVSLSIMAALGTGRGVLTGAAFFILPSLSALILFTQTCFVLLYPNRNDQAQITIGGFLSLFASILALLPSIVIGLALHFGGVGTVGLALGVTLTNLVGAASALAFGTFLWQRFDPTD